MCVQRAFCQFKINTISIFHFSLLDILRDKRENCPSTVKEEVIMEVGCMSLEDTPSARTSPTSYIFHWYQGELMFMDNSSSNGTVWSAVCVCRSLVTSAELCPAWQGLVAFWVGEGIDGAPTCGSKVISSSSLGVVSWELGKWHPRQVQKSV